MKRSKPVRCRAKDRSMRRPTGPPVSQPTEMIVIKLPRVPVTTFATLNTLTLLGPLLRYGIEITEARIAQGESEGKILTP